MGNDYDATATAKPDQSRNYKLISDPYLRPGHRVLFRYDGLSCQHRSPIQVCDPRKLKTTDPRSRRITELPLPDYAAKSARLTNCCTLNCSPPISFSPPPPSAPVARPASGDFVNLDGLSLSKEELIKLVQNYRNSKRPRRHRRSRHHSPHVKRCRQGSESSNVSYSTPTADSNELSEQATEPEKEEPKESLDSRIAALLGTEQQQQQQPQMTMPAQGLVFPPFFPNPMYCGTTAPPPPPPFYDPLRPPPPLPFQPVNFAGFGAVLRPTVPPMYYGGDYQRMPPASGCPIPPTSQPVAFVQPRPPMTPPEELRNQVVRILCGELTTVVRRDLSRKILSGVAFKCIDDWYEANDKRNKILQSGKYLKNSCLASEESKPESILVNGPTKTEPTGGLQPTAANRPYQPIPKFSSLKREAKSEKPHDPPCSNDSKKIARRTDSPAADEQLAGAATVPPIKTCTVADLDEWDDQESTDVKEEPLETHLQTIYAHVTQPVQPPDRLGDEEGDGPAVDDFVIAQCDELPQDGFNARIERATICRRDVECRADNTERRGSGRLDKLLLPLLVASEVVPCTRSLRRRTNLVKYAVRSAEEDLRVTNSYLTNGIDREDIQMLRKAYEQIMTTGKSLPNWLRFTRWVDHPVTVIAHPATAGCARVRGYCKLPRSKKNVQYGPAAAKFSPPVPVKTRLRKDGTPRSIGREVRSMQRRLMANIADTDFAEIFRFSQLKLRKKRLQFGRSRIHDWGLFACEYIAAEEMVIEYVGETIRQTVADKREQRQMQQASRAGNSAANASSYLFRIDADTIIDATNCGNLARFINHSCDPNCYAKIITVDQCKKVVIYSKREIAPGEEITYDYKFPLEDKKIPCNCGASNCRKTLN